MSAIVTYTDILPVGRAAAEWPSRKLAVHRRAITNSKGTRRLTWLSHVVYALRFLIDDALIPTNRARVEGLTEGCGLSYSGKRHRHGVNLQAISTPDGFPLWISDAQPGREHDWTAGYHVGVEDTIALLNIGAPGEEHLLVLADLRYEKFCDFPAICAPRKKPKGGELTEGERVFNRLHGALCALAEKANINLKFSFKRLDKVSLIPWRIGTLARGALAFFQIEHPDAQK